VEKESGKQVKALRSNNGGEDILGKFKDFSSKEGIRREIIAPHNPQQKGLVEMRNKTIVGATQTMLEREIDLHAVEECPVLKDEPLDWISHRRRFMEWKSPLMQRQT